MNIYYFYIVLTLAADKRLLVDIYLKVKRGREEKNLLERDMKSYMQFYTDKITDLKKAINQFEFMLSSASETGHSTNEKVSTNFFWLSLKCEQEATIFLSCGFSAKCPKKYFLR